MTDPIAFVEAAYVDAPSEAEWIQGVAQAARSLLPEAAGVLAFVHETHDADWVSVGAASAIGFDPRLLGALMNAPIERGEESRAMVQIFRRATATTALAELSRAPPLLRAQFAQGLQAAGVRDARFINATDPSRVGVVLVAPTRALVRWAPHEKRRWAQLAAHAAAGLRVHRLLRRVAAGLGEGTSEAILRPDGRVEHAEGPARGVRAREALRRGALSVERARGPLRTRNGDDALALWEGLVAGRWSLVDRFDSDGRRYLVAHRNDPAAPDLRGLTLRERQVVGYAAAGHSNKVIAYELGLTMSTVAGHLARARAKLALPSLAAVREALALLPRPS